MTPWILRWHGFGRDDPLVQMVRWPRQLPRSATPFFFKTFTIDIIDMIDRKKLQKIQKLGIKIDHDQAFKGKSKGNKHLSRVVRVAKFLAKKTGADMDIVEAAAYLHDTALPSGNDYDYKKNKKIVQRILKQFNLSQNESERIAESVASHEGTRGPKTLEAKIIHDADTLEKAGLLGMIRHTWKMTNMDKLDPANVKDADAKKILAHVRWRAKRLQTPLARKIEKYLSHGMDARTAKKIVVITAPLAARAVITEKIAPQVMKHLNTAQKKRLKEQLAVGYLKRFQ
jgi:HD superfamily phosphodiesterase